MIEKQKSKGNFWQIISKLLYIIVCIVAVAVIFLAFFFPAAVYCVTLFIMAGFVILLMPLIICGIAYIIIDSLWRK